MRLKKGLIMLFGLILAMVFVIGPNINSRAEGEESEETVTITFNYGINESFFEEKNYKIGDIQYSNSIQVKAGEYVYLDSIEGVVLPSFGTEINRMNFNYWVDEEGSSANYIRPTEDMTITALWNHSITYHAGEGKFFDGSDTYVKDNLNEEDSLLDVSICCYPNGTERAFVGWALSENATQDDVIQDDDGFTVFQNMDLYAVFVDGYSLTYNVNTEKGTIDYYYESYKGNSTSKRYLTNQTTVTFTYPNGVKPSEADYFSYDPLYYPNSQLSSGDDNVIYDYWSTDKDGEEAASFYDLLPQSGEDIILYAIWETYYTVTFDSNLDSGHSYTQEVRVAKGNVLNNIPYRNFYYTDDQDKSWKCIAFYTEKDGTGTEITYNYIPDKNITVYAQYSEIYYIYLDGNGGQIHDSYTSFEIDPGDVCNIGNDYWISWYDDDWNETDKAFSHWNTKPDGTGITPSDSYVPDKTTTLYAIPKDGVRVTLTTDAREGDEGNEYGTLFYFRDSRNVSNASFIFSDERSIGYLPTPNYINDDMKQFAGWSTEYGNLSKIIDTSTFIPQKGMNEEMTLYAVWYDMVPMNYHANGGKFSWYEDEVMSSSEIKGKKFTPYSYDEPYMSDGYLFAGWASRDGSSTVIPYGKSFTASESMDFYAVWEKGYTITLDGNGGSIHYMSPSGHEHHGESDKAVFAIKKGATVLEPSDSSGSGQVSGYHKDNLILVGFSKTKNGEPVDLETYIPDKDETFYAIWKEPCVVTYDPGEGKFADYYSGEVQKDYVDKGDTITSFPEVESEVKTLIGWFTDIGTDKEKMFDLDTPVNENITVTAKWSDTTEKVMISFDAGKDGSIYHNSKYVQKVSISVGKGAYIDLSRYYASQDNNENSFAGWKTDGFEWMYGASNRYYTANKDTDFTAIWHSAEYITVTFNGNGGIVDAINGDIDSAAVVNIKARKDYSLGYTYVALKDDDKYVFTGWYLDKECTKLAASVSRIYNYVPSENITLYAGWEEKTIAVTGVRLSKDKLTLGISGDDADTFALGYVIYPTNATNDKVTYSSSSSAVASVNDNGLITAVGAGEATITVTTADGGFKAECKVVVNSVTVASVKEKIDNLTTSLDSITDAKKAEEAVKKALEEIGGSERLSELVANDSSVADKMKDLEDAYKTAANITVKDPDSKENRNVLKEVFGISDQDVDGSVDVSGAALNAEPDETIGLSIKTVTDGQKTDIDNKFDNDKQLDIELVKGDGTEVKELSSPVTVTLPIPSGMIKSKLYILHFLEDGTYELIRPVFKNNTMKITVSHFSRFVIAELAENASSGDKPSPTATPTATIKPSPTAAKPTPTSSNIPVGPTTAPTGDVKPSASPEAVKDGATVSETGSTATYKVNSAADKTVTYTGDSKASGKVTVKSSIKVGNNTYTVVAIANNAFKKKNITAVTIPATVETIGKSAFEGCAKLKTVTIKGSKLKTIGDNAFKGCKVLSKITIPKSVTKVGKQAFANCTKLKTITVKSKKTKFLKNSLKKVPSSAKVKLPKMTSKEKKAFKKMLKKTAAYKGKYK